MLGVYRGLIGNPQSQLTYIFALIELMLTMSHQLLTVREDSQVTNTDIVGLATLDNQYMYILPHNAHHLRLLMWAGI